MAASLPRLLLREEPKENMLADMNLWCFALSAKDGWVGRISECRRTNGVERTEGEETPFAADIHPGWVGGPVVFVFTFMNCFGWRCL